MLEYTNSNTVGFSKQKTAQQSVHLTLGILRSFQAVSYALSFFWLDGFAVPTPAQVTQTVGTPLAKEGFFQGCEEIAEER